MLSLRKWLIAFSRSFFPVHLQCLPIFSYTQAVPHCTVYHFFSAESPLGWDFQKITLDPLYTFSGVGVWAFDGKCYVDSLLNGLRDLLYCLQLADCLAAYT